MREALLEAKKAYVKEEVPVGAVLVFENKILARAHNETEMKNLATRHAEILCIEQGTKIFQDWRLSGCTLYVTLEPCLMCAGAMINSRVTRLVYGAKDIRQGAAGSIYHVFDGSHPIHQVEVVPGVLAEESSALLKQFFKEIRCKKSLMK